MTDHVAEGELAAEQANLTDQPQGEQTASADPAGPTDTVENVEQTAEPEGDVAYLLRTFRVDDMNVQREDGSVDRVALEALMAAHGHLIAERIRIRG